MRLRYKKKEKSRLKILDVYCHQGAQFELYKTGHDFFLMSVSGAKPDWNVNHRPLGSNVYLITEKQASAIKFDVVIVRSPLNIKRYYKFIKNGAIPIAVVQTTGTFQMPREVKHVVWNSLEVMKRYQSNKHTNHYIVHGYDPNEFKPLDLTKNGRVLTVANVFKGRSNIMGYPLWEGLNQKIKKLDVLGHGNEDMVSLPQAETFQKLIEYYNKYSIYLNPTKESAMPRSRAEAAMCGMPIVSTNNFDINMYFKHNKNAILSNDIIELEAGIIKLLNSKQMQQDFGMAAREVAQQHFNITEYLQKWNTIFGQL